MTIVHYLGIIAIAAAMFSVPSSHSRSGLEAARTGSIPAAVQTSAAVQPRTGADARRAMAHATAASSESPTLTELSPEAKARSSLRFYIYTDPNIDQAWLHGCDGFKSLSNSAFAGEGMQEVRADVALRKSPYRVNTRERASLFYVPLWETTSFRLGECNGKTHAQRMEALARALLSQRTFVRMGGRDHFWLSSLAFDYPPSAMRNSSEAYRTILNVSKGISLIQRLGETTANLLSETVVGRMKSYGLQDSRLSRPHPSVVGRCTFDVGFQPNQHAMREYARWGGAPARPTLVYYAGGFDVCCTGRKTRCRLADLFAAELPTDVVIRPSIRPQEENATLPCLTGALSAIAARTNQTTMSLIAALRRGSGAHGAARRVSSYERMGVEMAHSVFCLAPSGDTAATSRAYTALAAGCIPVLLSDRYEMAFSASTQPQPPAQMAANWSQLQPVPYPQYVVHFSDSLFKRDPRRLIDFVRAMPAEEVTRRQAALALHRHETIFQASGPLRTSAASHVLEEVADCLTRTRSLPLNRLLTSVLGSRGASGGGGLPRAASASSEAYSTRGAFALITH